jgi:hypothetical protein
MALDPKYAQQLAAWRHNVISTRCGGCTKSVDREVDEASLLGRDLIVFTCPWCGYIELVDRKRVPPPKAP